MQFNQHTSHCISVFIYQMEAHGYTLRHSRLRLVAAISITATVSIGATAAGICFNLSEPEILCRALQFFVLVAVHTELGRNRIASFLRCFIFKSLSLNRHASTAAFNSIVHIANQAFTIQPEVNEFGEDTIRYVQLIFSRITQYEIVSIISLLNTQRHLNRIPFVRLHINILVGILIYRECKGCYRRFKTGTAVIHLYRELESTGFLRSTVDFTGSFIKFQSGRQFAIDDLEGRTVPFVHIVCDNHVRVRNVLNCFIHAAQTAS